MSSSGPNLIASQNLLRSLYACGVREIVYCAGARNGSLVLALEQTLGFETHSFFEERSAAFFALGRARRDRRPVAVLTTSGTAAAELLPAMIEAFHTGVPLIAVTADRPRRLRGSGAPQAIDQTGLFRNFISCEIDVEAGEHIALQAWNRLAPLHLNICFDEPLLDGELKTIDLKADPPSEEPPMSAVFNVDPRAQLETLLEFIRASRMPVAVIGTLDTKEEQAAVEEFLVSTKIPAYLESTSGLRESAKLAKQAFQSGDRLLSWALANGKIDSVLRIGGVPTVRIWRDLDRPNSKINVVSISPLPFSGLSRGEHLTSPIAKLLRPAITQLQRDGLTYDSPILFARDRTALGLLEKLFVQEPAAEPSLIHALSNVIPDAANVYVGNSLPIREWDLVAARKARHHVQANRGVNGIDGQLSTFLGMQKPGSEGWAIIGDLTALYDLASPWAMAATDAKARVVVINNGGGQIFSRLFKSPKFLNSHELNFSGWAAMWNLHYEKWSAVPQNFSSNKHAIIEIVPDPEATMRFWDTHDEFWRN